MVEKSTLGDGAMHPQWNDAHIGVCRVQIQYLTSFTGQELEQESHIKKIYTSTLQSPVELFRKPTMQTSPNPNE